MGRMAVHISKKGETVDLQGTGASIVVLPRGLKNWNEIDTHAPGASAEYGPDITAWVARQLKKPGAQQVLFFDRTMSQRVVLAPLPKDNAMFVLLGWAKSVWESLLTLKIESVHIEITDIDPADVLNVVDALFSALVAAQFVPPKSEKKPQKVIVFQPKSVSVRYSEGTAGLDNRTLLKRIDNARRVTEGTNWVRHLVMRPANDLTCRQLAEEAKQLSDEFDLGYDIYSQKNLEKIGAGAFLAVARGAAHTDAAIVQLSYSPARSKKQQDKIPHAVLVGKGVVYDTGGLSLKPPAYMFGMHGDMAGAAVVLALMRLAAQEQWPISVTGFLAIAENSIGSRAFRPNEVIKSLSGVTIETVHTDAEGRMMLADTLTLASRLAPDLIVDFATLTGSCVAAIGTSFSGALSNKIEWLESAMAAGRESGEQIWGFPLAKELDKSLESEIADVKQCRLKGGVDHIEAALFLQRFLEKQCPWVHIDLSSAEREGGLGHIETAVTGVGVRIGRSLIHGLFRDVSQVKK